MQGAAFTLADLTLAYTLRWSRIEGAVTTLASGRHCSREVEEEQRPSKPMLGAGLENGPHVTPSDTTAGVGVGHMETASTDKV
jgi:hypothetical protein